MNSRDNNQGSIPNQDFIPFQIDSRYENGNLRHLEMLADTVKSMIDSANLLSDGHEDNKAEAMYMEALEMLIRHLQRNEAEPLSGWEALEIRHTVLVPEPPDILNCSCSTDCLASQLSDTLTSMSELGDKRMQQGKFFEAEVLYTEALEIRHSTLGPEHPDTLHSMDNMANLLSHEGEFIEAEALKREANEIRERRVREHSDIKLLKEEKPSLVPPTDSQGFICNKEEDAADLVRKALEIQKKMLGPVHPDTLSSRKNLANLLMQQGYMEEAVALFSEALEVQQMVLEVRKRVLGREHIYTLRSMNNLANLLEEQEEFDKATQLYRETLEIQERVLGPEHADTLTSMYNLAKILYMQGNQEKAKPLCMRALEIGKMVLNVQQEALRVCVRCVRWKG